MKTQLRRIVGVMNHVEQGIQREGAMGRRRMHFVAASNLSRSTGRVRLPKRLLCLRGDFLLRVPASLHFVEVVTAIRAPSGEY